MNTKVKKGISLLCACMMCFACFYCYPNIVWAGESLRADTGNCKLDATEISDFLTEDSVLLKNSTVDKINEDINLLNRMGILYSVDKQVNEIAIENDGKIKYSIQLGEYENTISVDKTANGTKLQIQQDEISNTVLITENGSLYVDGNYIEPSTNAAVTGAFAINNVFEEWSPSPPYGSSGSYKYLHHSESDSDVDFTNQIKNITVGLFNLIFAYAMGFTPIVDAIAVVLTAVYDYFKQKDPTTTSGSYKAWVYTVKDGTGYISASYGYCYKYSFYFYSSTNFSDFTYSRTLYRQIIPLG